MNPDKILDQTKTKLDDATNHFKSELNKLRTGRAHPSMLDGVMVEAYGQPMPLIQVASIAVPEPQLLQITPFDPSNLQAISTGIRENQALGLNPADDGRVVRVPIPPLTTERRQQIVKQLHEKAEECLISMRNARHEALKTADQLKKDKAIGEDDYSRLQKQIDEAMMNKKNDIDGLTKTKEQEILTI